MMRSSNRYWPTTDQCNCGAVTKMSMIPAPISTTTAAATQRQGWRRGTALIAAGRCRARPGRDGWVRGELGHANLTLGKHTAPPRVRSRLTRRAGGLRPQYEGTQVEPTALLSLAPTSEAVTPPSETPAPLRSFP